MSRKRRGEGRERRGNGKGGGEGVLKLEQSSCVCVCVCVCMCVCTSSCLCPVYQDVTLPPAGRPPGGHLVAQNWAAGEAPPRCWRKRAYTTMRKRQLTPHTYTCAYVQSTYIYTYMYVSMYCRILARVLFLERRS